MNHVTKFALLMAAVASTALPAAALAGGPPSNPGTQNAAAHRSSDSNQPGPNASLSAKGKAYGRYCQNQSKTHVAGEQGTPFSRCVTAMAKLASGKTASPTAACSTLSKKHVTGEKGTPFSRCVTAAAKLLTDQHRQQNP